MKAKAKTKTEHKSSWFSWLVGIFLVIVAALCVWLWGNELATSRSLTEKIKIIESERDTAIKKAEENFEHGETGWSKFKDLEAETDELKEELEKHLANRPKKQTIPPQCSTVGGLKATPNNIEYLCGVIASQSKYVEFMEETEKALAEINRGLEKEKKQLIGISVYYRIAAVGFQEGYNLQVQLTGLKVRKSKKIGIMIGAAGAAIFVILARALIKAL